MTRSPAELSHSDRDAIRDLAAIYVHAVDRRRWHLIEHLFHPDAVFGFGPVQGGWRDFVDQARAIIDPCIATHHQLGQMGVSSRFVRQTTISRT